MTDSPLKGGQVELPGFLHWTNIIGPDPPHQGLDRLDFFARILVLPFLPFLEYAAATDGCTEYLGISFV